MEVPTSGAPASGIVGETLVLEKPADDTLALLVDAHRRGVTRIVTGFLPDELDWPEPGWSELLAWFVEHMEFTPRRLPGPAAATERAAIVLLTDARVPDEGGRRSAETLAHACAQAAARPLVMHTTAETNDVELARVIASATFVVNDVSDWSLGFAIDELAARSGVGVLRLHNPGYSPLRYALLEQSLPAEREAEIARLRPALHAAGWPWSEMRAPVDTARWFDGGENSAASRWRSLMGRDAFVAFWSGESWKLFASGVAPGTRWLNRPMSWALLAAAATSPEFPRATWERALGVMNTWLAAYLTARGPGLVLAQAAPRLARLEPTWIVGLERALIAVRDAREIVARWIYTGVMWAESNAPRLPLVMAGGWVNEKGGLPNVRTLVEAWARDWSRLPEALPADLMVVRVWRATCVDAVWFRSAHVAEAPAGSDLVARVLTNRVLWLKSFGGATDPLCLREALRLGRRDLARAGARTAMAQVRLPLTGGVARLARAVCEHEEGPPAWLSELAGEGYADADEVLHRLLAAWRTVRRWDLWRLRRPPLIAGELEAAARLGRARVRRLQRDPGAWQVLATLEGMRGDMDGAVEAIEHVSQIRGTPGELPALVACALTLRRRDGESRALLRRYPENGGGSPVALFHRALACQFAGELVAAGEALAQLRSTAPQFLADVGEKNDAYWVWGAAVMTGAGREREAALLRARAFASSRASEQTLADFESGTCSLAEGWLEFYAPALPGIGATLTRT